MAAGAAGVDTAREPTAAPLALAAASDTDDASDLLTQVLCINLDSRPDRLAALFSGLQTNPSLWPVPTTRISATRVSDTDAYKHLTPVAAKELDDFFTLGRQRRHHAQLSPGAVGCYLSHVDAWRRIAALSQGPAGLDPHSTLVLVLEDDANVAPLTAAAMRNALRAAAPLMGFSVNAAGVPAAGVKPPLPWMLIFHGFCHLQCAEKRVRTYDMAPKAMMTVVLPQHFWFTSAYVITPASAAALLAMPDLLPIDVQIDSKLSELVRQRRMVVGMVPLTNTQDAGTDINSHVVPGAPLTRSALS